MYPSEDLTRCPVRLVDKYMSLLPEVGPKTKKYNFYLRSLEKPNPAQWYGEQVVGRHTLTKVVGRIMRDCKLDFFVSNHSLRRTSTTRLLQGGVDKKTVKEFTGHTSDAIDNYQVTSEQEREKMSEILAGVTKNRKVETVSIADPSLEVTVKELGVKNVPNCECSCKNQTVRIKETGELGCMIEGLMKACRGAKTTIKLEIEFSD